MASPERLQGAELIDCAKANGKKGVEIAAERCGFGTNLETFDQALREACGAIGIEVTGFDELVNRRQQQQTGVEVGPDTPSQL
jgi:hypothetical protein